MGVYERAPTVTTPPRLLAIGVSNRSATRVMCAVMFAAVGPRGPRPRRSRVDNPSGLDSLLSLFPKVQMTAAPIRWADAYTPLPYPCLAFARLRPSLWTKREEPT